MFVLAVAAWLVLGLTGRATGHRALDALAGAALVVALAAGALVLRRERGKHPARATKRLFPPVGEGRWCDRCGHVTPREGPCAACGHAGPVKKRPRDAS